ncbi:ckr-1, partial [Pristionchus pacificus]|uniref:Ckr-1 n=1 Tax=Pristionchus pacificus TaxID=54126 RepID=A0A2A6BKU5_PRIPA
VMTETSITSQLIPTISTEKGVCELRLSWMSGILSVVYLLLFLFSVLSNVFVIITILGKRHLAQRSITNYYLLNLAIADLLRSLVCIPSTMVSELFQCWILGPLMCKLSAFLQPVGVCASAYTLAVIAVERYYAICEPLNSRNWNTKTRAVILLIGVWAFSFITNVASLLLFEHILLPSHWTCGSEFPPSTMFFYQLYITLVLLFIPLSLMIYLYGNVIYTLNSAIENNEFDTKFIEKLPSDRTASITDWFFTAVKQSRFSETFESLRSGKCSTRSSFMLPSPSSPMPAFPEQLPSPSNVFLRTSNQERILIAKRKVTRMLITIVVLFALCWTPNYIWWLVVRFGDAMDVRNIWNSKLNTALTLLTYVSSCTNPLTYCFMNKSFRRALLSYFKRNKRTKVQKRAPAQFNRNSSPAILGTPKALMPNVPKIRIDLVSTTQ